MLTRTIAAATASALLAGGVVAYSAGAAGTHAGPPPTQGAKLATRQAKAKTRTDALAQRLGVTADQLTAAQGALLKRNLDVRVAAGKLTVAERSAILACKASPLTCDRTNLPARAGGAKAKARKAAKRKTPVATRQTRRAKALAGELHVDQAKVLAALQAQRKAVRHP